MSSRNIFTRFLRGVWRGLDVFRRVVHLLIMFLVFVVVVAMFSQSAPSLPKSAALLLAPAGPVVEQPFGDAVEQAFNELAGQERPETALRDLVDALRAARDDQRIRAIALDLGELTRVDLSKLQALGRELDAFRETGRKIVAYGDYYSQAQYYLAAHADEVYLHPSGLVFLEGYGRYRTFFRQAIEMLKIDWHVFRVGEYKSFVEPYLRDDMSDEDRAASIEWLDALWAQYQQDVTRARGMESHEIDQYTRQFVTKLEARGGDLARLALDAGLVDELRTRDQVNSRLAELAGADPRTGKFKRIDFRSYVTTARLIDKKTGGAAVGVVVAAGEILDGEQPPGLIGGDTLAGLLQKARMDTDIKAVVLRIDSPGGSKFASEIIQREIRLLREANKPVIASMGGVAASGGYYIAMDADEIWAAPTTITGSIGIGAYFPTINRSLDALGVHVDGVGTTPWSGQFRPDRELSDAASRVLQLSVEHGYRHFVAGVAQARNLSTERVDQIARGRVWTGARAKEIGLIDVLGDLEGAIAAAASHAALGDDYAVRYIEKELNFREALAVNLAGQIESLVGIKWRRGLLDHALARVGESLTRLARFNDPQHLYYHCLCGAW